MLRTNLPESITLPTGEELFPVIGGHLKQRPFVDGGNKAIITEAKRRKLKYRRVEVLNRNLRGKLDLHHRPYTPTRWVFVEAK